jgi:hypothetical protein
MRESCTSGSVRGRGVTRVPTAIDVDHYFEGNAGYNMRRPIRSDLQERVRGL